jgi:hypothetical protein
LPQKTTTTTTDWLFISTDEKGRWCYCGLKSYVKYFMKDQILSTEKWLWIGKSVTYKRTVKFSGAEKMSYEHRI